MTDGVFRRIGAPFGAPFFRMEVMRFAKSEKQGSFA